MDGSFEELRAEVERAAGHYYFTAQQQGIDNRTKRLVIERCLPRVRGPRVLELGYVDGLWTDALLAAGHDVDVVEGASRHVAHASDRYAANPSVRVFHQLFQEFEPDGTYDTILAADVIRYLPDALGFLRRARAWLAESGLLLITVPNSRSLHRRIGALIGTEATPTTANERDREVGNLRAYDRYELRALALAAGYEPIEIRGCFLKPLSSMLMENWSDELLRALLLVGDELEDYCWFIYAVCRPSR